MPDSYQIIIQNAPASGAGAITTIYTVPSSTSIVLSSITICNTSGLAQSWDLEFAKGGGSSNVVHKNYKFQPIGSFQTVDIVTGKTLAAGDVIRGFSSASGAVVMNFYGDVVT